MFERAERATVREPVSNTPLEMWIEINASKIRAVTKSACI